jgi:glycosyltransferase involved in cell wall biosynthesis
MSECSKDNERSLPLVSIITVVYNNARFIKNSIQSVLSQNYARLEYVVIDGGSTDGTLDVIEKYREKISVFTSEADGGIYDALNKGVSLATGNIIGFLHSDDIFADKSVVSKIANHFEKTNADIIYGDLDYVRKDDLNFVVRHWRSGKYISSALGNGWIPPHPTFYARRDLYKKYGGFDISYKISADYDCMIRFLKEKDVRVSYIPEVLVKMRTGGMSNNRPINTIKKLYEDYLILNKNQVGGVKSLILKKIRKISQYFVR